MGKLKKREHHQALEAMQRELVGLSRWLETNGAREPAPGFDP